MSTTEIDFTIKHLNTVSQKYSLPPLKRLRNKKKKTEGEEEHKKSKKTEIDFCSNKAKTATIESHDYYCSH